MQDLKAERDEAVAKLVGEKELSSKRVYKLRKEVTAVQFSAQEDKERAYAPSCPAWLQVGEWDC